MNVALVLHADTHSWAKVVGLDFITLCVCLHLVYLFVNCCHSLGSHERSDMMVEQSLGVDIFRR